MEEGFRVLNEYNEKNIIDNAYKTSSLRKSKQKQYNQMTNSG